MADGIRCMVMRGGTSKGLYFLAGDLPEDPAARDDLLLRVMGSPDARQIDGLGGAHPLTSKVAVVGRSGDGEGSDADVDYRFLQVAVDEALVSDRQNCGNLLAGVGPFALERGLVEAPVEAPACGPAAGRSGAHAGGSGRGPDPGGLDRRGSADNDAEIEIRIRMLNTGGLATATVLLRDGRPRYDGDTAISGVPGTAAPVRLDFAGVAGSSCGALLPTGHPVDEVCGLPVTLIDNGMPVVVLRASDLGLDGHESCADLEANHDLRGRLEQVRLAAGPLMQLGDVTATTVPKLTLVAPPRAGGALATRTFIPHRCHDAIGVLGAVSVATAALLAEGPAAEVAELDGGGTVLIEHPTGTFEAAVELAESQGPDGGGPVVERAGIIRTARKLMDGVVFPGFP